MLFGLLAGTSACDGEEHHSTVYNLPVFVDNPTGERFQTSTVYMDRDYLRDNELTLQIGQREYSKRDFIYDNAASLGIDCAEEHEVRFGGELVGTIVIAHEIWNPPSAA